MQPKTAISKCLFKKKCVKYRITKSKKKHEQQSKLPNRTLLCNPILQFRRQQRQVYEPTTEPLVGIVLILGDWDGGRAFVVPCLAWRHSVAWYLPSGRASDGPLY